jgi:hypothetical protein
MTNWPVRRQRQCPKRNSKTRSRWTMQIVDYEDEPAIEVLHSFLLLY